MLEPVRQHVIVGPDGRIVIHLPQLKPGTHVNVTARDGAIVIALTRQPRGKQSLRELVSRIPKSYKPREVGWGKTVGKEAW